MNRWRNCSTAVSSDEQRAKLLQNYRGRLSFTSVSFWPTRTRDSTAPSTNNSVRLAKNPSTEELSILMSWTEGSARILTSHENHLSAIVKMNPMLRYFLCLTLKLVSNHLHISSSNWCEGSHSKGTLIEFLSRIILTQRLSHGDQSFPQYFCNCYVQVYN